MKPTLIEFECPSCHQNFDSDDLREGMDFACTTCNFEFTILARSVFQPEEVAPPAPRPPEVKGLSESERQKFAAIKNAPEDQAVVETKKIFERAELADNTANFFFGLAVLALVFALFGAFTDAAAVTLAGVVGFAGAAFTTGVLVKMLAQLIFIRAELRSKK